ncbi:hypothetical protein BC832DRAFT_567427 [Gaertneriomyces semiglobifer]|nr:hypothetical protein BC832DRAFT_567427 [Gaertneriomyces semiglobifer]
MNYSYQSSYNQQPQYQHPQQQQRSQHQPQTSVSSSTRLSQALADLITIGCLKGLRYVRSNLRGREECILLIGKDLPSSHTQFDGGLTDPELAALPPSAMAYLLAVYARYQRPFAWLRSSPSAAHHTLSSNPDHPLSLPITENWIDAPETRLADVLSFLITQSLSPATTEAAGAINPWSVDLAYFDTLSTNQERIVRISAMLLFLQNVLPRAHPKVMPSILQDVEALQKRLTQAYKMLL